MSMPLTLILLNQIHLQIVWTSQVTNQIGLLIRLDLRFPSSPMGSKSSGVIIFLGSLNTSFP